MTNEFIDEGPDPEQLTTLQRRAAITAAAELTGHNTKRAAAHLINFIDLADKPVVCRRHLVTWYDTTRDGEEVVCAAICEWTDLLADGQLYLTGTQRRFVQLAAALDRGVEFDLRDSLAGLGDAHARCVVEAFLIATGQDDALILMPIDKLAEQRGVDDGPKPPKGLAVTEMSTIMDLSEALEAALAHDHPRVAAVGGRAFDRNEGLAATMLLGLAAYAVTATAAAQTRTVEDVLAEWRAAWAKKLGDEGAGQ
jgi:hypothetical protein